MLRREILKMSLAAVLAWALVLSVPAAPNAAASQKAAAVSGWFVTDAVTYENLSVFPVVMRQPADTSAFVTLDEALTSGEASVTELGGDMLRRSRDGQQPRGRPRPIPLPEPQIAPGAQVNRLVLVYRGAKPLVLLAGEVLTGGKQDRVIAKDRIVAPGAEPLPLDVFCVERGRWSGGTSNFTASNLMVHPSVREKAAVEQKQDEVWAAVLSGSTAPAAGLAGERARLNTTIVEEVIASEASSESYRKIYQSSRVGRSVETFAAEVERRFARATAGIKEGRVVGVVIAYGGEMAWADVFASPELFNRYWSKLVRSYAVEAMARPHTHEKATLEDARDFLKPLGGREVAESEPGVYLWRQRTEGRYAEILLEALAPKSMTLHWVKIHRTT